MFYAAQLVSRDGPLQVLWVAATLDRQLNRQLVDGTAISRVVEVYLAPDAPAGIFSGGPQQGGGGGRGKGRGGASGGEAPGDGAPLALRLSGQLLLGVCRIYSLKVSYLLQDCEKALLVLKNICPADAPLAYGDDEEGDSDARGQQQQNRTRRDADGDDGDGDTRRAARGRRKSVTVAAAAAAAAVAAGGTIGPDGEPLMMPYDEDEILLAGTASQDLRDGLDLQLGPSGGSGNLYRAGSLGGGAATGETEDDEFALATPHGGHNSTWGDPLTSSRSLRHPWSTPWAGADGGAGPFTEPHHPAAPDDQHAYFDDEVPDHFEFDLDEHEIEALRAASQDLDQRQQQHPAAAEPDPFATPQHQRHGGREGDELGGHHHAGAPPRRLEAMPEGEEEDEAEDEAEEAVRLVSGSAVSAGGTSSAVADYSDEDSLRQDPAAEEAFQEEDDLDGDAPMVDAAQQDDDGDGDGNRGGDSAWMQSGGGSLADPETQPVAAGARDVGAMADTHKTTDAEAEAGEGEREGGPPDGAAGTEEYDTDGILTLPAAGPPQTATAAPANTANAATGATAAVEQRTPAARNGTLRATLTVALPSDTPAAAGAAVTPTTPGTTPLERGPRIAIDVDREGRLKTALTSNVIRELLQDRTALIDHHRRNAANRRRITVSSRALSGASPTAGTTDGGSPWLALWGGLMGSSAASGPAAGAGSNFETGSWCNSRSNPSRHRDGAGAASLQSQCHGSGSGGWLLLQQPLNVAAGPAALPSVALAPSLNHLFRFLAGRAGSSYCEQLLPEHAEYPPAGAAAGGPAAAPKRGRKGNSSGQQQQATSSGRAAAGAAPTTSNRAATKGAASGRSRSQMSMPASAIAAGSGGRGAQGGGGEDHDDDGSGASSADTSGNDSGGGAAGGASRATASADFSKGAVQDFEDGMPSLDMVGPDVNILDLELDLHPDPGTIFDDEDQRLEAEEGDEAEEEGDRIAEEDPGEASELFDPEEGEEEEEGGSANGKKCARHRRPAADGFTARTQAVLKKLQGMVLSSRRVHLQCGGGPTRGSAKRRRMEAAADLQEAEEGTMQITTASNLLRVVAELADPAAAVKRRASSGRTDPRVSVATANGLDDSGVCISRMAAARTFYDLLVLSNRGYISLVEAPGPTPTGHASAGRGEAGSGGPGPSAPTHGQSLGGSELLVVARQRLEEQAGGL